MQLQHARYWRRQQGVRKSDILYYMVLCMYSYTQHIYVSVYIYMCLYISITPALDAASACAASAEAAVCRVLEGVIYSIIW